MAISEAFNRDCLEAMKEYPDKYFDLAVVDPPYGDGCSQTVTVEREREPKERGTGRERTSDSQTARGDMPSGVRWNRFGQRFDRYKNPSQSGGWHGKDKYHRGNAPEQAEDGLLSLTPTKKLLRGM